MLLAEGVPTALFNHSRVLYLLESIVLYHLATIPAPILCVCVFAFMYVCVLLTCGCLQRPEDPPELELEVTVSHHVGGGNQTQILWKSSQCS